MNNKKKAVDTTGVQSHKVEKLAAAEKDLRTAFSGVANGPVVESVPLLNSTASEKVISGDNNAYITLGRDKPGSILSGYGGKAHTQCGTIDLVVGLGGSEVREVNEKGQKLYNDKNFISDIDFKSFSQFTSHACYLTGTHNESCCSNHENLKSKKVFHLEPDSE